MVSNALESDVALEVKALVRRTKWIRLAGISLTFIGVVTAVAALVGQICSRIVSPSITDFKFDIPESILSKGASFDNSFSTLNFVYDGYLSFTGSPVFYVPLAIAMCYYTYKFLTGDFDTEHMQLIAMIGMLLFSPKFVDVFFRRPLQWYWQRWA